MPQKTPTQTPEPTENTFTTRDGTKLFYRAWIPRKATKRSIVFFHRGHEHSGRLADVIEELGIDDAAIFAWDQRGHGRSPGLRGYAPSFGTLINDADCFVRYVSEQYKLPIEQMAVVAHSVGAVIASAWVHDYAPPIRALVIASPALRIKLYVPLAIPGLRILQKLRGERPAFISSYVKSTMLTHDFEQAGRYQVDPLITREIAVNILLGLHDAATRLMSDAGAIRVPTLWLAGSADWVVHVGAERKFYDGLGSHTKRMRLFEGMYHDILHEKDRRLVLDEIRVFLREAWASSETRKPLLDADTQGYTREEHDWLEQRPGIFDWRHWWFGLQRLAMRTAGSLSDGIQLGWMAGFDSGRTLDYVYKNKPGGRWGIGKWMDKSYLDSPGWRGIRQRKVNLERLLAEAIRRTRDAEKPVRIVDIAAGAGRYLLETIARDPEGIEVRLRDYQQPNLDAGKKIAEELRLSNATFELGDAFDEAALASIEPAPTIAVVSGLYELYPDNARILASLRGLAKAMQAGGLLIYTCQPWHPQLEMIARVLINREGKPWIMRRRTQEEMDDLVRAAGFAKLEQAIDDDGIFSVSLAKTGE